MEYIIHYDVAAAVVALATLICFLTRKNIMNYRTKIFLRMLWCSLITSVADIVTVTLLGTNVPAWISWTVNAVYLMGFSTLPLLYFKYILSMSVRPTWWSMFRKVTMHVPYVCCMLFIATSPFTRLIFYLDDEGKYWHGAWYIVLYASAFCYMLVALIYTIRNRRRFSKGQMLSVVYYSIAILGCILLQSAFPEVLLLQFAAAVSIWIMYQALENAKNLEKTELGVYNRRGFMKLISASVEEKEPFMVLGIRFSGFQVVRENLGAENSSAFHKQLADFLIQNFKNLDICWMADGVYTAYAKGGNREEYVNDAIRSIRDTFNSAVVFQGMEIVVTASLFTLDYPRDVETLEDILDMIDYEVERVGEKEDGIVIQSSDEVLGKFRREHAIAHLMRRALADNKFAVFYQPIYSVTKKKYCSAEALVRLMDDELGFVGPDEFIPIAEKNGTIFEIGEFVFRSVCSMLAKERLWEKGIDYVEVNLSPVQCMEADLHKKLLMIMDEYELPYDYINLEITETATVSSEEMLRHNIDPLLANGVTFSLDDYGTGYSNISNVISYPFQIIKIDKSMVWSAMKNDRAMRALRHTVEMIKDLDISIVAEGVETDEQAELLMSLGCTYLQGYYYSKPMPEDKFIEMLREAWDVEKLG